MLAGHLRKLRDRQPAHLIVVLGTGVLFAAAVITFRLWGALALMVACIGAVAAVEWHGGRLLHMLRKAVAAAGMLGFTAVLVAAACVDQVWVPEETLLVGRTTLQAYVMQVSPASSPC